MIFLIGLIKNYLERTEECAYICGGKSEEISEIVRLFRFIHLLIPIETMYTIQGLTFEILRLLIIVMGLVNIPLMMIRVCRKYRGQEATKVDVFLNVLLSLIVFSGCLLLFFLKPFENLAAFTGIPMPGENEAMLQFFANSFYKLGYAILATGVLVNLVRCVRCMLRKGSGFRDWAGYLFLFLLCLSAFFW